MHSKWSKTAEDLEMGNSSATWIFKRTVVTSLMKFCWSDSSFVKQFYSLAAWINEVLKNRPLGVRAGSDG